MGSSWAPLLAESLARREEFAGNDTQRRNWDAFNAGYTTNVVGKMRKVYDDASGYNEREQEQWERILRGLSELLVERVEAHRNGELDGQELLADAAAIEQDRQRALASAEAAAKVEARAWEQVDRHPAEFQKQTLDRFPALRQRLPRLSDAVLNGTEEPKF